MSLLEAKQKYCLLFFSLSALGPIHPPREKHKCCPDTIFWVLFCMFWACTWATLLSPLMHVLGFYQGNTFESSYAGFWACNGWGLYPLQAQTVHNRTPMCVWEAPNTCCSDKWAIGVKRSTSAFVLPIIVFHQPSLRFILRHKCQQQDYCWSFIMWQMSRRRLYNPCSMFMH
jgi:hypothetical protein